MTTKDRTKARTTASAKVVALASVLVLAAFSAFALLPRRRAGGEVSAEKASAADGRRDEMNDGGRSRRDDGHDFRSIEKKPTSDVMMTALNEHKGSAEPSIHFVQPASAIASSNLGVIVDIANFPPGTNISVTLYLDGALVRRRGHPPYEWGSCSGGGGAGGSSPDPALRRVNPGAHELRAEARYPNDGDDAVSAAKAEIAVTIPEPIAFSSGYRPYDEAYATARSEADRNVECGRFIAGAGWTQLWTRDTSYAVDLLSGGVGYEEAARASLEACTEIDDSGGEKREVWLQDVCGHFDGWPNLSDAIVGAQGAWSYYLHSGNRTFLDWAYDITKASLERAERDVYDRDTNLFLGCSSFMESNSGYPSRYAFDGKLVGRTKALSTNVLYYLGYRLGADMATELGALAADIAALRSKAETLRRAVRSRLWLPDRSHYAYFEDERGKSVPHAEGLGTALALLAPGFETDPDRIDSIFNATYRSQYGLPCLWPRFDIQESAEDIATYYHNGRLWPFVGGYWAIAAARHGHIDAFAREFDALVALHRKSGTFAEFYELDGTSPHERRRQLWSDTGFLGAVHRGLFGMEFGTDGVRFRPVKPPEEKEEGGGGARFGETVSLRNVRYRGMILHVHLSGTGTTVGRFELDGRETAESLVPYDLTGEHTVRIALVGGVDSSQSRLYAARNHKRENNAQELPDVASPKKAATLQSTAPHR